MFELLYTSVSAGKMSDSDLISLLDQSREKNKRLAITGMLIYHNREFVQILEGEKNAVQELYQTIADDDRHTSVKVFYEGEIKARAFQDWTMAFKKLEPEDVLGKVAGFEEFGTDKSLINLVEAKPNAGKELFLFLREELVSNT